MIVATVVIDGVEFEGEAHRDKDDALRSALWAAVDEGVDDAFEMPYVVTYN